MEDREQMEQSPSSSPPPATSNISLQQAIDLGEYKPEYLSNYAEWHTLSPHIQWQFIRKALDVRQKQLITHYAELSNTLDLS